ncbi:hypothetical protein EAO73_04485 [Streptomyces sp. col6]|nr:hypothetical protein EAO73_04485 [Streptomyces sp. col6]
MTETKTRSPELRLAAGAIDELRHDLFQDAFAYRPMAPMRTDGPLTRRLPGRLGAGAAWIPHAAVLGAALITFMAGFTETGNAGVLLSGLLPAICVAMTLIRPVGAFWMAMALMPVSAVVSGEGPWGATTFFSHLVVLFVVAARTRPRTAAWMWALTLLLGLRRCWAPR